MEEKNIFEGQVSQSQPNTVPAQPVNPPPSPQSQSHPSDVPSQESSSSQSYEHTVIAEPTTLPNGQDGYPPKFSFANIVKIFIGLFSIALIGFIIFAFILPNLNKKEQKVELTLWDNMDSSVISAVLPEFEKQNPNIKVNLVKQDIKDYKDRLLTRTQNGTGPDIFRFHNTWVLQLPNILLPIPSDVITKEGFNKTFYPVVRHDLIKDGAVYGIPIEIDVLSLFINTAMLKEANVAVPTNWNDFITTSRTLTIKNQSGKIQRSGAGIGTFENVVHASDIISLLFAQDSVNLDDISQTKPRVADALNFYSAFALSDGSVWDTTLDPSILAFSKGNLAMYFGYYRDLPAIRSANSNLSFDIVSVPHLTGQNQTIASYYPLGISLNSKHQKEALLLLKFLSQKSVAEKEAVLPVARVDIPDKSKGQAGEAVSSFFAGETFDNGLNTSLNTHLAKAINSILSGESPDLAADTLILGFSQVLAQFKPSQ